MPLIRAKAVEPRDTLTCRVDRTVHEQLKQYAAFIDSPKEYVVAQALERLFRSDKDFAAWLATRSEPSESAADESHTSAVEGASAVGDDHSGLKGRRR